MNETDLQLDILRKVALALVLGGVIGWERERADKPAGFRTQMMVAGASALLVGLGSVLLSRFEAEAPRGGLIQSDPMRIIEAIVTAIGFIGAGTIFRRSATDHVEGLTTAASLLMTAAIGIAVALDQVLLAVGVTLLSLLVLWGLGTVEERVRSKNKAKE
jgi:putative Mg2+ transporter-C (MgtC) family protein